jgi:nitrogen-specific signal transduction histidine kinase
MFRLNPLLWPKPPAIWDHGIAVLSVGATLIITRTPALHLQDAHASRFLSAVMLSAWFAGLGPGPAATTLSADQIFSAFLTTKSHGTGLGLRISRSILESHGGLWWAADNRPRGASFQFTLSTRVEAQE